VATLIDIPSNNLRLLEFVVPAVAQKMLLIHQYYDGSENGKIQEIQSGLNTIKRNLLEVEAQSDSSYLRGPIDSVPLAYQYGANTSRSRRQPSREPSKDTMPTEPEIAPSIPRRSELRQQQQQSYANGPEPHTNGNTNGQSFPRSYSNASSRLSPTSSTPHNPFHLVPGKQHQDPVRQKLSSIDSISHDLERIELASNQRNGKVPSTPSTRDDTFTASVLPSSATTPRSPNEDPFHQIRMLGKATGDSPSGSVTPELNGQKNWKDALSRNAAVLFDQ
jgi:hypothetical protein